MKLSISVRTFEGAALNPGQTWATPRVGEWKHCTQNSVLRVGWGLSQRQITKYEAFKNRKKIANYPHSYLHGQVFPFSPTPLSGLERLSRHCEWMTFGSTKPFFLLVQAMGRCSYEDFYKEAHHLALLWAGLQDSGLVDNNGKLKGSVDSDSSEFFSDLTWQIITDYLKLQRSSKLRMLRRFLPWVGVGAARLRLAIDLILRTRHVPRIPEPRRIKRRTPLLIRPPIQPNAPGF